MLHEPEISVVAIFGFTISTWWISHVNDIDGLQIEHRDEFPSYLLLIGILVNVMGVVYSVLWLTLIDLVWWLALPLLLILIGVRHTITKPFFPSLNDEPRSFIPWLNKYFLSGLIFLPLSYHGFNFMLYS